MLLKNCHVHFPSEIVYQCTPVNCTHLGILRVGLKISKAMKKEIGKIFSGGFSKTWTSRE